MVLLTAAPYDVTAIVVRILLLSKTVGRRWPVVQSRVGLIDDVGPTTRQGRTLQWADLLSTGYRHVFKRLLF